MDESPSGAVRDKRRVRHILTGVLTAAVAIAALLVFALGDSQTAERVQDFFGLSESGEAARAFAYASGADQVFAAAGNGLAVASDSAIEFFNGSGDSVFRQPVHYDCPTVLASTTGALFCDLGGEDCTLVTYRGESRTLTPQGTLLGVSRTEDGWCCLTTAEAGYKGLVSLYDAAGTMKYQWYSGSGYVLKAAVSPDHAYLAALCAEEGGGKLHIYRTDATTEQAAISFPGELPFDLAFLTEERICVTGDKALDFFSADGKRISRYNLGDYTLADYDLGGREFAAVFVRSALTGQGGLLQTFDTEGTLLAYAAVSRNPVSLSASGKKLLLMTDENLVLYDRELHEKYWDEGPMDAVKALLRSDGSALLAGSYGAERKEF